MSPSLRNLLDIGFLAGLVFALFLGDKVVPLLIIVAVVPIPLLWSKKDFTFPAVPLYRLLIPVGAYFAYCLGVYFLFTGLAPNETRPINPDLQFYLIGLAMLAIGVLRGLQVPNLYSKFQSVVPWALIASFGVLSIYMFFGFTEGCRVRAEAAWPFIPALLFSTLTFLSLMGWKDMTARTRLLRMILIALSVLIVIGYTGSRGVAVGQCATLILLAGLNIFKRYRGAIPRARDLATAVVVGLMLCILVELITGCGGFGRLMAVFRTGVNIVTQDISYVMEKATPEAYASERPVLGAIAQASPTAPPSSNANAIIDFKTLGPTDTSITNLTSDASISQRLEMWKVSIQAIKQAPFFGHGSLSLQRIITERFGYEHNHNQFLSWLVTGGILVLGLGLWFLATPYLMSAGLDQIDRIVIGPSVSVLWAVSMLFDSFLNLDFYFHYYCILLGFLYAMVNDMVKSQTSKET